MGQKTKTTILIVEDEISICNFISTNLKKKDYKIIACNQGKEAVTMINSHCPDLILLDLGLPDMDGMEILEEIRSWSEVPVLIISARTTEKDKVQALDMGADDYITKPFGTEELMARIRTALRHTTKSAGRKSAEGKIFRSKDLIVNFEKQNVKINNEKIHLTKIEYKLVSFLAENAGKVLTYDTIIKKIWGPHAGEGTQILRVNMANIRRKLEQNPADPAYIFTEVGVGYRMVDEDDH